MKIGYTIDAIHDQVYVVPTKVMVIYKMPQLGYKYHAVITSLCMSNEVSNDVSMHNTVM